jgi:hypothetical protein
MTYGYCRDAALKLFYQYSIGGTVIAASYNNQYDYLKRVPELINDAVELVSLAVGQPEGVFVPAPEAAEDLGGGWCAFDLPEDFVRLAGRGLARSGEEGFGYVKDYRLLSGRRLALPRALLKGAALVYLREPAKISLDSPETAVLDLPAGPRGRCPATSRPTSPPARTPSSTPPCSTSSRRGLRRSRPRRRAKRSLPRTPTGSAPSTPSIERGEGI